MIASGELARLVDDGIVGLTSNPTLFDKAIRGSNDYDDALANLIAAGKSDAEVYEALVIEDIRAAADILLPVYERTDRADGYVSLEVNPNLAHDTAATVAEAKRLFALLDRPNAMIKVPATPAGLPAIRAVLAAGINVNVTLIFAIEVYRQVTEAYRAGLADLVAAGGDPRSVASVASFFVSRVDTLVDQRLNDRIDAGQRDLEALKGRAAVANAKIAYELFTQVFTGPSFEALRNKGARPQRPLWASTSTKNPDYPDTLYVDALIGPDTVNTIPPATLVAFMDHGRVTRTLDVDVAGAHRTFADLQRVGIDLAEVTDQLLHEGVASFADSFNRLMANLKARLVA